MPSRGPYEGQDHMLKHFEKRVLISIQGILSMIYFAGVQNNSIIDSLAINDIMIRIHLRNFLFYDTQHNIMNFYFWFILKTRST